jgi:putative transposase
VIGGCAYHVCNRGSRKGVLFETSDDFDNFEQLMNEARAKRPMRITGYCLMRTHVHFLLWPREDGDLSRFMHWLSGTHARRWHWQRRTIGTGAVYQSRYVSVPITDDRHLLSAWRYIEKNALEAGLVKRAEDWRWSSAWQAVSACPTFVVDEGPIPRLSNWLDFVNDSIGEPPHAESEAPMHSVG